MRTQSQPIPFHIHTSNVHKHTEKGLRTTRQLKYLITLEKIQIFTKFLVLCTKVYIAMKQQSLRYYTYTADTILC